MKTIVEYQVERMELAQDIFVGKKIKSVRYASQEELEDLHWDDELIVLELEDGTLFYPSRDGEGNNSGVLFVQPPSAEFHQF
jgi:hypothetical protein